MFPFPAVPFLWKFGIAAALLAIVAASSYVAGRKAVREQMDALKQSYAVAAAQAAGREAERARQLKNAIITAGVKYGEAAKVAESSFDGSLDRLRNAYSSRERMRSAPAAPAGCPGPSGPSAAYLLEAGTTIAELARDADKDRAALVSCVESYPR